MCPMLCVSIYRTLGQWEKLKKPYVIPSKQLSFHKCNTLKNIGLFFNISLKANLLLNWKNRFEKLLGYVILSFTSIPITLSHT